MLTIKNSDQQEVFAYSITSGLSWNMPDVMFPVGSYSMSVTAKDSAVPDRGVNYDVSRTHSFEVTQNPVVFPDAMTEKIGVPEKFRVFFGIKDASCG